MIGNRSPLKQSIQERVVDRTTRLKLDPDTGVGTLSLHHYRQTIGSTNTENQNFWQSLAAGFLHTFESFFSFDGLLDDDIFLDVVARTPTGNKLIPNLRLNCNNFDNKNGEILSKLQAKQQLYVKILYDGGRASEVTPVSWVFENPGATKIKAENTVSAAASSSSATVLQDPSVIFATSASQSSYLTDEQIVGQYSGFINQAATNFGVDANLVAAVIACESSGRSTIVSSAGAIGLMQMEPGTFKQVYLQVLPAYPSLVNDPFNPQTNVFCGTKYLSNLQQQFNSNLDSVIGAYNAGPGATATAIANGTAYPQYTETINYVAKVKRVYAANCQRSQQLALTKLQQRPEVSKTEQTNATANSAQVTAGAGTV